MHCLSVCTLLFACAGCGQDVVEPQSGPAKPERTEPLVTGTDHEEIPIGANLTRQVQAAMAELAGRVGVSEGAITVVKASMVNWGSSAVGCPRQDMNYTQVIVPGILVLLEADGRIYRYHGSREGELFHCPDERAEAPAFGSGDEFM